MTAETTTSRALLLDLNKQVGEMRADMGKMLAGLGHVTERQKEFSDNVIAIEMRLDAGSHRHAEFSESLALITHKLETLVELPAELANTKAEIKGIFAEDGLVQAVTDMKPQVKELMDWKARLAAQTVVASAIVGSALWMIWEGLKWFFPHSKDLFDRVFH
jgi:uncharacterized coiled-coil protein SlyX